MVARSALEIALTPRLVSGAGPSWLSPSSFSGVFRLNDDSTMTLVADVTSWLPDNPPASIPPDYGSDGSLFDLEAAGDALLLSEAVGGQLLRVTPAGEITTVADLSEGHLVPTGIAVDQEGNAYVGFESTPPWPDCSSKVVKVTPDGTVSDQWTGLLRIDPAASTPISLEGVGELPPTCEGVPGAASDATAETTPTTAADG